MNTLGKSAQSVQQALSEAGLELKIIELPASTRTAVEAAEAIGCQVAQICKSLVFMTKEDRQPILVLASGSNRVNEKVIAKLLGQKITKADAVFTREVTGFAIGGIPPIGHKVKMRTFIDEDLKQYDVLWAAGGTPNTVFSLEPSDLQKLAEGEFVSVC